MKVLEAAGAGSGGPESPEALSWKFEGKFSLGPGGEPADPGHDVPELNVTCFTVSM